MRKIIWTAGLLLTLVGCTTNSGKTLNPVTAPFHAAERLVGFMGDKVDDLFDLRARRSEIRTNLLFALPSEQAEHLQKVAVPIERDYLDSSAAPRMPSSFFFLDRYRTVALEIEQHTGYQYHWFLSTSGTTAFEAMPNGVMILNPALVVTMSEEEKFFAGIHETMHHIHGHLARQTVEWNTPKNVWCSLADSLECDRSTSQLMAKIGFPKHSILIAVELTSQKNSLTPLNNLETRKATVRDQLAERW